MKKLAVAAALAVASFITAAPVLAASTNADVSVKVNLTAACKMSTPSAIAITYAAFGAAVASTASEGTFTVNCSQDLTYAIGFDSAATPAVTKAVPAATDNNNLTYTLSLSSASGTGAGTTANNHRVIATVDADQAGGACTSTCPGTAQLHTVYVVY